MNNERLLDWVMVAAARAELVVSVCTGALILAKAGLLDGLTITTHHDAFDLLTQVAPKSTVVQNRRFVDSGKIITSAGISAGIDVALYVVAKFGGKELAEKTAREMEYHWEPGT